MYSSIALVGCCIVNVKVTILMLESYFHALHHGVFWGFLAVVAIRFDLFL